MIFKRGDAGGVYFLRIKPWGGGMIVDELGTICKKLELGTKKGGG